MTPQSVEDCLQSTLSSLYPPFEVTAPTLLTQVFSVLERTYREDPLRYTLEFLIPAKRILQNVQHQACSQYSGFLFFHEGWPLCLGDKILIQLSSLPWHFLKNGDFYLQVVPYLECSPRLVLKCLSQDGSGVQEIVVPESSHPFLFSAEWLNSINKDRSSVRLENCLASVEEKVLRLPWSEVIYPRFIHKEGFIVGRRCPPGPIMPPLECRSPGDGGITIGELGDPKVSTHLSLSNNQEYIESWREGAVSHMSGSLSGTATDSIEGEYVELSAPSPGFVGKVESHRDTWTSRAKTAPSRKGKKKGHESWLHQRKPGKVGSLSTLKGMTKEIWEDSSCVRNAGEQTNSAAEGHSYWDVDTTNCSTEIDVVAEWRKGLNCLQRQEEDIFSARQMWGSSERKVWNDKDYSEEHSEVSWGAERAENINSSQEDAILSKTLKGCSLKDDIVKEKDNILSLDGTEDISDECKKVSSGDSSQPSKEGQSETFRSNNNMIAIVDCQSNCPLDFLKQLLKENSQPLDTHEEVCHSRESSLTRPSRTWADGQETSNVQGEGDNTVGDFQVPSNETKSHPGKGKHHVWGQVTEISHKTGRGRRKKRNKRGRGPLRAEARKVTHKVEHLKTNAKQEEIEPVTTSKDEVELNINDQDINDRRLSAETVPPSVSELEEPSILADMEPEPSLSQSPLLQTSCISDFKCLLRDVNWDILESEVFCLTGGQDRDKRALLIVSPAKAPAENTQRDLQEAILYLFFLLRSDLRDLGMTLILDLRDGTPHPETFLQMLDNDKESVHRCINRTLLVYDMENPAAAQSDLLNAQVVLTTELTQYVEADELPESLGGKRPYIHSECVKSQQSLSQLHSLCCDVLHSLEKVTQDVESDVTEDFQWLVSHHRDAMKTTLTDERLQKLQRDGGTLVAKLQKSPYLRLYDPLTFDLYERVDEALHRLVQLSNKKLQELEAKLVPQDYRNRTIEDSQNLLDAPRHGDMGTEIHGESQDETRKLEEWRMPAVEPEGRRLEVGVRIRGLEVSSRELADRTCSPPRGHVLSRGDGRGPDAPWGGIPRPEGRRSPQRLLLDLLCSERSYVQSLRRSLEVRGSCPAGLALRGNLEQLLNFHTYFLRDLQNCVSHPLNVSYCFMQHEEQLRLYSLYVKNKQKVELFLPSPSGSLKGRRKDQKEEDESWGILQRPLEQLDQYQRFLGDMMQECDQDTEQERQSLQAARELVGSLVHHGKNMLAAEAIRGFEVDEKEHGRLLLKDVFTVLSGRKKSLRHVFLFQRLLLLSKLKTAEGGLETYGFKQAFKTADMGLTENATEGDTRIELWFRRQKSRETLLLQAETCSVKETWTNEITKLLWDQGGLSREHRVQDTSTIGSSHRSFLDIKAGFNAISERTVSALLTARGSRSRASVPLSSCEHSSPPSSLSLALTSWPSPRRLRSPGGVSLPDKISEEGGETFTGGPVCLKSISPILEGEKPKDVAIKAIFPSTSV
ncbi:rho guanine nucleotide exchange factor 40 isoform X2 [Mixophyes fleayi]|uniref:rho guanine nucleotide exchange factor 40 isoform X2 n=1 Tax=Mixophyes fleayi TaxID=3061075 RepID=UPI003F4E256E